MAYRRRITWVLLLWLSVLPGVVRAGNVLEVSSAALSSPDGEVSIDVRLSADRDLSSLGIRIRYSPQDLDTSAAQVTTVAAHFAPGGESKATVTVDPVGGMVTWSVWDLQGEPVIAAGDGPLVQIRFRGRPRPTSHASELRIAFTSGTGCNLTPLPLPQLIHGAVSVPAAERIVLTLAQGWNLVGVSVASAATIGAIFDDGLGHSIKSGWLWRWDRRYYRATTDAAVLTPGCGYWVYCTVAAQTQPITGTPADGQLTLVRGWNLVSPLQEGRLQASRDVDGPVWSWDALSGSYTAIPVGGLLRRGQAYWVFAVQDGTPLSIGAVLGDATPAMLP